MHVNLLPILLQLHSYYPESSDEYMIHAKYIQTGSSGNYYQKSTELSDTLEKTDERVALNWEQLGEINIFINRQRLQRTRLCFLLHKCNRTPKIYFEKLP